MVLTPSLLITAGALISHAALVGVILYRRIWDRPRIFFLFYLLAVIWWSFTGCMIFGGTPILDALFWNRALIVGSMAAPLAFFGFVSAFVGAKRSAWLRLGVLGYLVAQICNAAGWVVTSAAVEDGFLTNSYGPALAYVSMFWLFYFGFSAYELIQAYRHSKDTGYRNRLLYLLLVVGVIFTGNLTNLTDLESLPLDVGMNIIAAFIIMFAIVRHNLLDITVVARKGVLYSIPTVLVGATYYLVIEGMLLFLPQMGRVELLWVSILGATLVTLLIRPVLASIQIQIDRLFFREQYDAGRMLERISRSTVHVLDLGTLTRTILQEVTATLHIARGAIFIRYPDSGEYMLTAVYGVERTGRGRWPGDHPLVEEMGRHDQPITRAQLAQAMQATLPTDLEPLGAELFIPLKVSGALVGIFTLGMKRSELTYTPDDLRMLTMLAGQIAMAVENARLFSAEQVRRAELDTLYDLTRTLSAANSPRDVFENATREVATHTGVDFVRILTQHSEGKFYARAAFPEQLSGQDLPVNQYEPGPALPYYRAAVEQHSALILQGDDPYLTRSARAGLLLDRVEQVSIFPLEAGRQTLGLLVVGERGTGGRLLPGTDRLRLVSVLAAKIADALQRVELRDQMEDSFMETILALANALDARDTGSPNRNQALCDLAEAVCQKLRCGEDEAWALHWAALLHDIGKIGIPDQILQKNGTLSSEEWETMRQHPLIGARIVAPIKKLANVAALVQAHHERYDGSGYPNGLKGSDIPRGARILAIADAYIAMTAERGYRGAFSPQEAIQELRRGKGTQFDPELVEICASLVERGRPLAS